jgi:hypothetical protein
MNDNQNRGFGVFSKLKAWWDKGKEKFNTAPAVSPAKPASRKRKPRCCSRSCYTPDMNGEQAVARRIRQLQRGIIQVTGRG